MGINDPVIPNESQQKKDKLREDLERQIKEYLESGGRIKNQPEVTKTIHRKKPQR
jgi:hypothetical protein